MSELFEPNSPFGFALGLIIGLVLGIVFGSRAVFLRIKVTPSE